MEKVIFSLETEHLKTLDRIVTEAKFGTDRSKVLRAILEDFFKRNGVNVND